MRPSWDEYFIGIAEQVSSRSTCSRAQVGCVLVRDNVILATGYNGAAKGLPHCDEVGHDIVNGHCVRTVHAEQNAIIQAARHGTRLEGCIAYCTHFPCWHCTKHLINAGITHIVYKSAYRADKRVFDACIQLRITLEEIVYSDDREP